MSNLKKIYIPVFLTNIITFLSVVFAYFAYAKVLSPEEFGVYSLALALNSFGTLFLESGTRNAIIKRQTILNEMALKNTLVLLLLLFSFVLIILFILFKSIFVTYQPKLLNDYVWVTSYISIFWISSPFIVIPTAFLEKKLKYNKITWIESVSVVLERALPFVLMYNLDDKLYAFSIFAILSRIFKAIALNTYENCVSIKKIGFKFQEAFLVLKESFWIQFSMSSYLIRDNIHILFIGPIYGKLWLGYYSWGLQICSLSSQVLVQMFSRLSVSISSQLNTFEERWDLIRKQMTYLSLLTNPILFSTVIIIPYINIYFFNHKWDVTVSFLPLLIARMIPGVSTTPLASLLMVDKKISLYAKFSWYWTCIEVGFALMLIYLMGPVGLAVSLAFVAWWGVWLLCRFNGLAFWSLLQLLVLRKSFVLSLIVYGIYYYLYNYYKVTIIGSIVTCAVIWLITLVFELNSFKFLVNKIRGK